MSSSVLVSLNGSGSGSGSGTAKQLENARQSMGTAISSSCDIMSSSPKGGVHTGLDANELGQEENDTGETAPPVTRSNPGSANRVPLHRGETLQVAVQANGTSMVYEAWPIRMQIDYSVQFRPGHNSRKTLLCGLEWLREEDAEIVRQSKGVTILDAEFLQNHTMIRSDYLKGFYLSAQGTLLRLSLK
ncbi:hypothetical protein HIM_11694 [Hirsutella minnesotensis 3608]|uniref:Uncharacterized protein n=1 Tax=Hirsutella minnesotensis 3608 TaxID=1043627 RepID=A0A0F7ZR32_9HYPO|nr:hypothetical protein HIM_11694 [Hirsutella minnesotensis 3608]